MKYILKIFLIVLLVVAIIGAACWFFLDCSARTSP